MIAKKNAHTHNVHNNDKYQKKKKRKERRSRSSRVNKLSCECRLNFFQWLGDDFDQFGGDQIVRSSDSDAGQMSFFIRL